MKAGRRTGGSGVKRKIGKVTVKRSAGVGQLGQRNKRSAGDTGRSRTTSSGPKSSFTFMGKTVGGNSTAQARRTGASGRGRASAAARRRSTH